MSEIASLNLMPLWGRRARIAVAQEIELPSPSRDAPAPRPPPRISTAWKFSPGLRLL